MNKVLLVGSLPPPYHGQSIAFDSALNAIKKEFKYKVVQTSFRGGSRMESLLMVLRYVFQIPLYIFFYRPDKIYFLCSRTLIGGLRDLYLLFFCMFSKSEVLNHLHGSDFELFIQSLNPLHKKIVIALYKRVNRHAVLIEGMQEQLVSVAKQENIFVINNFYLESKNIPKQVSFKERGGKLSVFYLSSIVTSKGIFELIEAVKMLSATKKIELIIAGGFIGDSFLCEDMTKKKFFSLIDGCSFVNYIGVINIQDKYKILGESDILALPSYYKSEAVPLCIIEGMRMGCCILTSNYKYLPSLVKDGINGVLVDPQSVESIISSFTDLYSNLDQLNVISSNNIKEAKNHYSENNYQNKIIDYIRGAAC